MQLLVFDTTHHALWAEELAREHGLAAEVLPSPAAARAKCDLALEFLPSQQDMLLQVLAEAGVAFRLFEN